MRENKYEHARFLWKSVREAKRRLYTPSTDKFDGYSQYPRPVTRNLDELKKFDNSFCQTYSKIKITRNDNFFNLNLPKYLTNRHGSVEKPQKFKLVIF